MITGRGVDTNFGLAQCYGDLSLLDYGLCYAEARTLLPQWYPYDRVQIYLDGCFRILQFSTNTKDLKMWQCVEMAPERVLNFKKLQKQLLLKNRENAVIAIIRDQGPRDPSLLHLQATHRSRSVWRTGAAPLQYFRRRDSNQSDLNIDVQLIPILQAAGFYGVARGVVLETIAARTADVISDMSQLATQSLHHLRDRNAYKFDRLQVEEQDARQDGGGEDAVDEPDDDADHADEQDHLGTGEDRGPESSTTAATATVADASAAAAATATATIAEASTPPAAAAAAAATTTGAGDWFPSFSLGLSWPSQPLPEQQTSHMLDTSTEQPPAVVQRQHRLRPWHGTLEVPFFDLGSSSQSTQSTQPSQPGTQRSSVKVDRADPEVFFVCRSKRDRKAPDCGTGSHRG
ncbi:hypothetical protein ACET3Z_013432 [Daucus carota]